MEHKLTVPPTSVEGERDDRGEGGLQKEETKRKREREEERRGREGRGRQWEVPYSSSTPSSVDLAGNLALGIWKMQLTRECMRGQNKS